MRKFEILLILPVLCASASTPAWVETVITSTRSVPGEFAADALIRIAALDSVEKPRKIQLLEQAFQRAAQAQEPFRRQPAILKVPGSASFLNRAFSQELDGLSLRLRAIAALEPLDPAKARSLFQQIPTLHVPRLSCADFMVYDVAPYYRMLARMAPPSAVLKQVGVITSPVQVPPAIEVVLAAQSDADFRAQLGALTAALGRISGDDRSFTSNVRTLGAGILSLVEQCNRRKISPLPLLESYRLYLVTNEQTARCADDDLMEPPDQHAVVLLSGQAAIGGEGADFFNSTLRMAPLQAIQEVETTPTKQEGVAEGLRGCQESSCKSIVEQYTGLIFNPDTKAAYSPGDKAKPEWQERFQKFLASLAEWKPDTATTEAQYYRQKSSLYADALSMVQPGPLQDQVVKAMLAFAQENVFKAANRIEWFLPVNVLVGRMAIDPLGIGRMVPLLRESKDPVIVLYSNLEAIAPRPPDKILAIM